MSWLGRALAISALSCALLAIGCGGSSAPATQAPSADGDAVPAADPQAGDTPPAADEPGAPLTEAECHRLADHLVDLNMNERRQRPAGAQGAQGEGYSAEDAETAKRELRQTLQPMCAQLSRRDFTCALAAKTAAEMVACQPPPPR